MGAELLFLLIPATFLFGMAGFAVVAARFPDLASPRWAALGFGFAVSAAVVDSMRGHWSDDVVMLSVPLHWAALAGLMQAFLSRKPVSSDAHTLYSLILAGGIANVMVSRVHYLPDLRIVMVNLLATLVIGHAVVRLSRYRQAALDRTILAFLTLLSILYLIRIVRYYGAGLGGDYGDLAVWSAYKIAAYFSASLCGMFAALLLAIACGSDIVARLNRERGHDSLTGIPNRYAYDSHIMDDVRAGGTVYDAVIMIDLDHFKAINDSLGHAGGDAALMAVASVLRDSLARYGDLARIGGEEFAVLVRRGSPVPVDLLADRALHAIRAITLDAPYETARLSASLGHAVRVPGQSISQTIRQADLALYEAKLAGRNRASPAGTSSRALRSVA